MSDSVRPAELAEDVRRAWAELIGPGGYLPVLALLLGATVAGLLVGDSRLGGAATLALGGAALVITVFRSTDHARLRRAVAAAVALAGLLTMASPELSADGRHEAGWLALATNLGVVATALPLVLFRALRHRRVTVNTVCATVSAYLLIGMLFTAVYRLHGLAAPPFFSQGDRPTPGQYAYFSFMTLTTVGFGDLTPGSDAARAWVVLEAVAGQVYVITALARVVSLLGGERRRGSAGDSSVRSCPPA